MNIDFLENFINQALQVAEAVAVAVKITLL